MAILCWLRFEFPEPLTLVFQYAQNSGSKYIETFPGLWYKRYQRTDLGSVRTTNLTEIENQNLREPKRE
jgi:hypothetical protein